MICFTHTLQLFCPVLNVLFDSPKKSRNPHPWSQNPKTCLLTKSLNIPEAAAFHRAPGAGPIAIAISSAHFRLEEWPPTWSLASTAPPTARRPWPWARRTSASWSLRPARRWTRTRPRPPASRRSSSRTPLTTRRNTSSHKNRGYDLGDLDFNARPSRPQSPCCT